MKSKKELIKAIPVNEANLLHIAKTGVINGSLLMDIEKAMDVLEIQIRNEFLNCISPELDKMNILNTEDDLDVICDCLRVNNGFCADCGRSRT